MAKEAPRRFSENQTSTQYPPVMAYFDVTKETSLTVDARPVGISAILSQKTKNRDDSKIIPYASHSFDDLERRYSQTERRLLVSYWLSSTFTYFFMVNNLRQSQTINIWKQYTELLARNRLRELNDGFYDYNRINLKFSINQEVRTPLITYPDTHQIK